MKLITLFAGLILTVSGKAFHNPQVEHYANTAEEYQTGLEQQQQGLYSNQLRDHKSINYQRKDVQANARPQGESHAKILNLKRENNGHQYQYVYETENGIKAAEEGTVGKGTKARGAFSYKGDDGHVYSVTYTADEHGFRPTGEHLPTPPPIPELIQKGLQDNAKDEASGIYDDGTYREHQGYKKAETGQQSVEYQSVGQSGAEKSTYYPQSAALFSNSGKYESLGLPDADKVTYYSGKFESLGQSDAGKSMYYTQSDSNSDNVESFGQSGAEKSSYYTQAAVQDSNSGKYGSLGQTYIQQPIYYTQTVSQDSNLGNHVSSDNSDEKKAIYYSQTAAIDSNSGKYESSGQSANSGYFIPSTSFGATSGQSYSGYGADSGFGSSTGFASSSGYSSLGNNQGSSSHKFSITHDSNPGHLSSLGKEASSGHNGYVKDYSNRYVGYRPSGFTARSAYNGITGHYKSRSYLPPSNHLTPVRYHN